MLCDVEVASWKRFWKSEDGGPRCCQDCGTGKRGGEKILAVLGGRTSFTATYRELKGLIGRVHPPLLAHLHPPSPHLPGQSCPVCQQHLFNFPIHGSTT